MIFDPETRVYDGDDELLQTYNLNVYEDTVNVRNFLGFDFTFVFETTPPKSGQRDIQVIPGPGPLPIKTATIIISSVLKENTFGGGNEKKLELVAGTEYKLLFSVFARKIGDSSGAMHVTISFYQKKI